MAADNQLLKEEMVPSSFKMIWDIGYSEMLHIFILTTVLVVFILNYFIGRNMNRKLANTWFSTHKDFLEKKFGPVGDVKTKNNSPGLVKQSDNIYVLKYSGHSYCKRVLVELVLLKRQNFMAVIASKVKRGNDQVRIGVHMNNKHMKNIVMCVATKKTAMLMSKNMADLSTYCRERTSVENYGLPPNFLLVCELMGVALSILDSHILTAINKYADLIDCIYFSDQCFGPKVPWKTITKLPKMSKILVFNFNLQLGGKPIDEAMEQMRPLLELVIYCMKKVKELKLTTKVKQKAEKNRLRVQQDLLRATHNARVEAAAARRKEKKRQERENIQMKNDPDKEKKFEDREKRRQLKKKAPKIQFATKKS